MNRIYTVTRNNLPDTRQWLKNVMTEEKLSPKEIYTAQLLIEEIFLPMANVNAKDKNFSAQISIAKWFGDISIKISAFGENYNPFADIDELTTESDEYLNLAILSCINLNISERAAQSLDFWTVL